MVGVSDGALQTVKASINAHQVGHEADLGRLGQSKDKPCGIWIRPRPI
jgi:hypothetical protein